MKYVFKIFLPVAWLFFALTGCEKDEAQVLFEGGVAPVLTASTDIVDMSFANADNVGLTLKWTNPDYKFNTGVSSQTVNYSIEIDLAGNNFSSSSRKIIDLASDLRHDFTVAELNDAMLNQMGLNTGTEYNLEMRVTSSLVANHTELVSNTVSVIATPYAIPPKVSVPGNGDLWIVGDVVANGWSNPVQDQYITSHKFTKVDETTYELTIDMNPGDGYKLIQDNGSWGSQYHALDGGTWEAGNFEKADAEPKFPGPPASGSYKITMDFQKGKYSVIKL